MKKHIAVVILMLMASCYSLAQMKTVELKEVVVEALPFEKYISGSKIEKSDSLEMAKLNNRTLADYLKQNSTVYIKEQGNAMLASVSFRGTGSSHTGVFWHGININSLTLGSTDFNGVPLFLFDDIAVQYGGASSLHGSDAIGGSIHLNSKPQWTMGSKVQLRQDIGSFGHYFSGVKLDLGNGKWESKTRIFNRSLKNNFKYSITDRLGTEYEIEQANAEVHNYGVLQTFNGKISKSGYLSIKGWYGENAHDVQPLMVTEPNAAQTGDEIVDRNLRIITEYEQYFDGGFLTSGLGYVWDYELYNGGDLIETRRAIANLGYEWTINDKTTIKGGGNGKYIVPNVYAYEGNITEWRGDVFLSTKYALNDHWILNVNARQTFVPFTTAPVAPSFSTSYTISKTRTTMTLRGQAERSYRVPTFNDRYWPIPGLQERPDLLAENGFNLEAGYNLNTTNFGNGHLEFDVTGFYMKVDDWIIWSSIGIVNGKDVWKPSNLKQVESTGIEFKGKITQRLGAVEIEAGGMYAFNKTTLLKGTSENDPSVGYQLPYTPKHRAGIYANLTYRTCQLSANSNYTSMRYGTNVISEKVDDYLLTDIQLSKNISFGQQLLSIEAQLLNVFDVEYQNVKRYAMPGRNYLLSINIFINN